MDLPRHYLPTRPCPYKNDLPGSSRAKTFMKFADWGSLGNVDLREEPSTGVPEFKPQYGQQGIKHLNSVHPATPLLDAPQYECWRQRDAILGVDSYLQMLQDMRLVIVRTRQQNSFLKHKKSHCSRQFRTLKRMIENLSTGAETTSSSPKTAEMLRILSDAGNFLGIRDSLSSQAHVNKAFNENCWHGYNPDFYGGLLCHIPRLGSSKSFLVHASGERFNDLCLTKVSSSRKCPLSAQTVHKESSGGGPVFQIVAQPNSSEGWFSTRHKHGCNVYRVDHQSQSLAQCGSVSLQKEALTSVYYSPYSINEVLMSTDKGSVFLWDINTRHRLLFQRPAVSKMWTGTYLAGHPRQVVMANRTALLMFDHRSNYSSPRSLFTPGESCQLMDHEKILAASLVQFPHHVLLTDHSVLVLDQRFLQEPVMQWSHELPLSAPQYIQIHHHHSQKVNNNRGDNTFLFVGAQQPSEVLCFPFNITSGQACTASSLPFRTGRSKDVFLASETVPSYDTSLVKERFEASLAGLTLAGLPKDQGFTVFQMDSYGDLFYQPYRIDHSATTLDFLGDSDENVQAVKVKCTKWMEAFKDTCAKGKEAVHKQSPEVCLRQDLWDTLFSQEPNQCKNEPESSWEHEEFDYSSLPIPKQLSFTEHLPQRGVNTRLLLAQKNNESFGALLEAREAEHKRLRKRLRRLVLGGGSRYKKKPPKSKPLVLTDNSDSESECNISWGKNENSAGVQASGGDSSDAEIHSEIPMGELKIKTNFLFSVDGHNSSLSSLSDLSESEPAGSDMSLVDFPKPSSSTKKARRSNSQKKPHFTCAPWRKKKLTLKSRKGPCKPVLKKPRLNSGSADVSPMGYTSLIRRQSERVKTEMVSYCEDNIPHDYGD